MRVLRGLWLAAILVSIPSVSAVAQQEPAKPRTDAERAVKFLQQARQLVAQANAETNAEQANKMRTQARSSIESARGIHRTLHDRHKAELDRFPRFIPESEPQQRAARAAAETGFIGARLELARCAYETAQTYPDAAAERKDALKKAADEYETIHVAYRSLVVGLMADLWRGKCFQEMGEIGKAIGIYNDLLAHPGSSPPLKALQDQSRHFKLICLNDPQRSEFQFVIDQASEWLDANEADEDRKGKTAVGLGIRWERARACEALSRSTDVKVEERREFRQRAIDDAAVVRAAAHPLRDSAARMIERLEREGMI